MLKKMNKVIFHTILSYSFKYMLLFEDYLEPLDFLFHIPHAEQVTVL